MSEQDGREAEQPHFALVDGATTVHIVVDGQAMCGRDFVNGHEKFRARRWRRTRDAEDLPDGADLCQQCDVAYGDGVTMSSCELADAVRAEIGLDEQNKPLTKSELAEVYKELRQSAC